jgi:hypothetical protein
MICANCGKENEEGADVCVDCGQTLSVLPESQPVDQAVEDSQLDLESTAPKQNSWLKIAGIIAGIAAVAALVVFVLLPGLKQSTSASNLVFAKINGTPLQGFSAMYRLNNDLKSKTQLGAEKGTIVLPVDLVGFKSKLLSPKGSQLTLLTYGTAEVYNGAAEIIFVPTDGTAAIKAGDNAIPYGLFTGYSSDNQYFAATIADQTSQSVMVQITDMTGKSISKATDTAFAGFLAGNKEYLGYNISATEGLRALVKVDVLTGVAKDLYVIDQAKGMEIFSYLTPDSNYFYYHAFAGEEKAVYRIATAGGEPEKVYTFTSQADAPGVSWIAPDGQHLVIYDFSTNTDGSSKINMILTGLAGENPVVLSDSAYDPTLLFGGGSDRSFLNESTVAMSADGKYIAYLVQNGEDVELYTNTLDGKNPVQIAKSGLVYALNFAPDNQHLVYQKIAATTDSSGELSIASLDGKTNQKVDDLVGSFQFDGNSLIYFKLNEDATQTSLLKVSLDGKNPQTLFGPEDGWYVFIK